MSSAGLAQGALSQLHLVVKRAFGFLAVGTRPGFKARGGQFVLLPFCLRAPLCSLWHWLASSRKVGTARLSVGKKTWSHASVCGDYGVVGASQLGGRLLLPKQREPWAGSQAEPTAVCSIWPESEALLMDEDHRGQSRIFSEGGQSRKTFLLDI